MSQLLLKLTFGRILMEHYDALTNNLCVWGCLDCLISDRISRPEMLNNAEDNVDGKKLVKWGSRFYLGPGAACLGRTFSIHSQLEYWTRQLKLLHERTSNRQQEREDWTQAVCGREIRVLSAIGTYAKSAVSPDICLRHAHADQDVAHRTLRQSRLPEPQS
ncbi:unnamed protein product [Effrenium voratum]|nr:unnamed protein product [Effrenium voratum]